MLYFQCRSCRLCYRVLLFLHSCHALLILTLLRKVEAAEFYSLVGFSVLTLLLQEVLFWGLTESAVSGKRHKLKDFFFWCFWKTTLCGFWDCNCYLPSYANQPCQSTKHLTVSLNCLQKVEFFMCKLMCCRLSISAVVMSYLQNPQPMSMPWWRQAMVFSPLFARHWYVYLW